MLLLIDKPKGITSHDVVDAVRRFTHERRVGHAGTLDPNATGLLIVGVGREDTKKLGTIALDTKKTYIAEIILGEARDTDDAEGKVIDTVKTKEFTLEEVKSAIASFLGTSAQIPPQYSAIKKSGEKAYDLARKGISVNLGPREITVYEANLINYQFPKIEVEFSVSSGTYIRSIARDLGEKLGSAAYLNNLRRTKIGEFNIEDAKKLEEFSAQK